MFKSLSGRFLILTVIFVLAFINRLLVTRRTSRQAARG